MSWLHALFWGGGIEFCLVQQTTVAGAGDHPDDWPDA